MFLSRSQASWRISRARLERLLPWQAAVKVRASVALASSGQGSSAAPSKLPCVKGSAGRSPAVRHSLRDARTKRTGRSVEVASNIILD